MSDKSSSNTTKVVLVAGGALIVAGAAWYFLRPKKEEEQVVFSSKPKQPATTAAAAPATVGAAAAVAPRTETPTSAPASEGLLRTETTMMVNEYSFDPSNVTQPQEKPKVYIPPVADSNGNIYFETIGVKIQQTRGWTIAEETSPMPNVAMLSFSKAEFAERGGTGMPGEVPVVLLSIEDISNESISVDEFRAKSKHMAITQMQMMTNGMFEPNVTEDSKLSTPIGPFTHILLYELRTPYFSMQVMNLTAVVDGLAYILQLMCNGNDFSGVRKEVVEMAKTAKIDRKAPPKNFRSISSLTVTSVGGKASIPSPWAVDKATTANPVFRFTTASQSKAETVEVYNTALANSIDLSKPVATETRSANGLTVTDYGKSLRVVAKGTVIVVCKPKHGGSVVTTDEVLTSIADSVDFGITAERDSFFFHSHVLKLGFNVADKSRLIESRVSERILVYAPNGLPTDMSTAAENPMLTIRVGDPSNDPDCRVSYEEWLNRIRDETDGDTVSDLKRDTVAGRECVTFVNKEMQEVGPGQKEERMAKVIIFLTGVRTTMLRWETPTGAWRKFEGKLNSVVNSLVLDA